MSLIVADRVQETTNTTGTGAYTLGGVVAGFRTFASVASNADTVYYAITDNVNYEVGLGTYASSGGTIARTTIFASSNSNNAVNWGSGTKNIFLTYPADKAVIEDASNNVTIGNNLVVGGTVDGVDIAARDAVLTSTTTTANAALPKAGGAMTGAITTNSTFDGRDVATDGTKLDGIEASADVTDTANVTSAGALMDSELTNLAAVKAINQSLVTSASPTFAGLTAGGNIAVTGTVDGRDVASDGTKLDTIETNADVTDTANVTSAGALMDSEVDADIKTLSLPANTTISAYGKTIVDDANASAARTTLGVAIGSNVQAYSSVLQNTTASFLTADETKLDYITVTQAVSLDQMETDIAALENGMVYKGDWNAGSGSFPGGGSAQTGWFYYVSGAGTVNGIAFAVGDNIVATTDNASTSTYASNWSKHDQTDAVQAVVGLTGSIAKGSLLSALNVEDGADVTDTANVTSAGALMDSEVTNLAQVKAFDSSDYATAAQGTKADAALPKAGGAMTGAITTNSTFDGRDVATDGTKLDGIEASADVTDTANVTAAGALMDSEVDADIKTLSLPANTTISAYGKTLVDDADAATARTTLGLGTAATTAATAYATAAQGTKADAALPKAGGAMTGAITTNSTFDGRDVATDGTKLDGIEASADVTDTANVTAAGALMDSEVDADIKTLSLPANTTISAYGKTLVDDADAATARTTLGLGTAATTAATAYATAAQGTKADAALPKAGGAMTGAITTNSTFDGRDVATDGAKLDGIAAGATNVTNNNQLTNGAGYTTNVGDITGVTAGSGISGGGTSGTVTVSHSDTSSQSSVNNSGATVIQDVTLDTYGHVTGLASHTMTLANLGYTGATNANYITNNNQLTNGAGYVTSAGIPASGGTFTGDVTFNTKTRLAALSSNPSSPSAGHVYFNTTTKNALVYNGAEWKDMSEGLTAATGGTVTTSGNYKIHTFTSTANFVVSGAGEVEYLVIAGGGGGGMAGGGAGGYLAGTIANIAAGTYSCTVGAGGGGSGGRAGGSQGGTSSIGSLVTTVGGGYGGGYGNGSNPVTGGGGGSGGGGGGGFFGVTNSAGGSGTSGQGNNGGTSGGVNGMTGGGGGKSAVGTSSGFGRGGAGLASSINGSSVTRGGGGGAGSVTATPQDNGGYGGGGRGGSDYYGVASVAGTANTGGGGGGNSGKNGGSGIIIIRYIYQ